MARPVTLTADGKKGAKANGKRHLNASLPEQLVFDFNAVAKRQGHGRRDALVEDMIRRFLETVAPDAPSLKQSPSRSVIGAELFPEPRARVGMPAPLQLDERDAIRLARQHAQQIIAVTDAFSMRKPPKAAPPRRARKRHVS